jgi:hypothetical protein
MTASVRTLHSGDSRRKDTCDGGIGGRSLHKRSALRSGFRTLAQNLRSD